MIGPLPGSAAIAGLQASWQDIVRIQLGRFQVG